MEKALGVLFGGVIKFFAWIAGIIFDPVAKFFDFLMTGVRTNIATWQITEIGWVAIRDVFNMFFILILLVIAFATVLGIQDWQYKRLLPRLIISIILVNFSRTICAFFIEFSDLMMYSFTFGNSGGSISARVGKILNVEKVSEFSTRIKPTNISDLSVAAGYFVSMLIIWGFIFLMIFIIFMLIKRIIALMLLTVVSPAVFVLDVLPVTRKYSDKWWETFMKYIFYGPIVTFCMWFTLAILQWVITPGNKALTSVLSGGEQDGAGSSVVKASDFARTQVASSQFTLENLFGYIFVAGMFIATGYLAAQGGGALGKATAGALTGGASKAPGFAARLAGGAARLGGRSLARGSRGLIGRTVGAATGGVAGYAFGGGRALLQGQGLQAARQAANQTGSRAARATADALRYASPSTLVDSFNRQREQLRGRGEAADRSTFLNAAYNRDPSLYGAEINSGVSSAMQNMQAQDPTLSSGNLISTLKDSFNSGDKIEREAALSHLMQKGSFGELLSAAQTDDSLKRDLFSSDFLANNPGDLEDSADLRKDMFDKALGNRSYQFANKMSGAMEQQGRFDMSNMADINRGGASWNNSRVANDMAFASMNNMTAQQQAAAPLESDYAMKVGTDGSVRTSRPSDLRELSALSGLNNPQDNAHAWRSIGGAKRQAAQDGAHQDQAIELAAKSLVMNYALNGTTIKGKNFSSQKGVNGSSKELSLVAGARGIDPKNPAAMNALRSEVETRAKQLITTNKDEIRKFAEKHLGSEYANSSGKAWKDLEAQIDRSVKDASGDLAAGFKTQINRSMANVKTDFE